MSFKYSNDRASLRTIRHIANSMCTYTFISVMSIPNLIAHALNTEIVLIHKSFVSTAPLGPGNSKAFNFSVFEKVQVGKDQEKAQSEKDSHSKNQGGKKPN